MESRTLGLGNLRPMTQPLNTYVYRRHVQYVLLPNRILPRRFLH
jgi:hypothetical protein